MAKTNIKWDRPTAMAFVDGYGVGARATSHQMLQAWGYLIRTGWVDQLGGWYARVARALIEQGVLSDTGRVLDDNDPYTYV